MDRDDRVLAVSLLLVSVLVACAGETAESSASVVSTTEVVAITASSPGITSTTISEDAAAAVFIAVSYLEAKDSRDADLARSLLAEDVFLDSGPASSPDEFEPAWAWEDAFGISHEVIGCEVRSAAPTATVVLCEVLAQTAVAEALGGAPGIDCIDIAVVDGQITRVIGGTSGPNCVYDYWTSTFVPFNAWVKSNHPESNPTAMYNDRLSEEGLALWQQYTDEFLAEHRD